MALEKVLAGACIVSALTAASLPEARADLLHDNPTAYTVMEDDFNDEDFHVPSRPGPESSPASPDVDLEFFPFGGLLRSFEGSLQPCADMKTHAPEKEDQSWEKHDIEDEVFVHSF